MLELPTVKVVLVNCTGVCVLLLPSILPVQLIDGIAFVFFSLSWTSVQFLPRVNIRFYRERSR